MHRLLLLGTTSHTVVPTTTQTFMYYYVQQCFLIGFAYREGKHVIHHINIFAICVYSTSNIGYTWMYFRKYAVNEQRPHFLSPFLNIARTNSFVIAHRMHSPGINTTTISSMTAQNGRWIARTYTYTQVRKEQKQKQKQTDKKRFNRQCCHVCCAFHRQYQLIFSTTISRRCTELTYGRTHLLIER